MQNKKPTTEGLGIVCVGGQWGDEGKGRIVDCLSPSCDIVARFHGGNNAGHTIYANGKKTVLHILPCGIMQKGTLCLIGNGVVLDPEIFLEEIQLVKGAHPAFDETKIGISPFAHILFPFHRRVDKLREQSAECGKIGTTQRGIGPCYEDKVGRRGIRLIDLKSEEILRTKLQRAILHHQPFFQSQGQPIDQQETERYIQQALLWGKMLSGYMKDVSGILVSAFKEKKTVLFEGAQGALLDIDHGTYPFVTSSHCLSAQASLGTGVGPKHIHEVIMVSKAYSTRVGEGPFLTEILNPLGEKIREQGKEYGATTGRPRRCGWLDLPALSYAAQLNGATSIALTKIDVLMNLPEIKVCMGYKSKNDTINNYQDALLLGKEAIPQYVDLQPFSQMQKSPSSKFDLPESIQQIIQLIERHLSIPVSIVSFGPERGQEIWCNKAAALRAS